MCTYLHKAPNGVYYFRMGIPVELRPRFDGRREIKHSLRTKDRDDAKRLIPDHTKAALRLLEQARGEAQPVPATQPAPVSSPARAARLRRLEAYDREQDELAQIDNDKWAEREWEREERQPLADHLAQRLSSADVELTPVEAAAKDLIEDQRFEADLAREQLAFARMAQYKPQPVDANAASEKSIDTDPGSLLNPGIFDQWKSEGSKRPKTIDMVKKSADWFQARIGNVPVQEITKAHILDFKKQLIAEGQTVANINVRLSHISLLLGWAARNDVVPVNVAKETQIPNPQAKKNRRKPFDLAALKAIFGGPVHAKGERPKQGKGEAAYWLPVLALFTGARVRELAQLRRGDVSEQEYPDADGNVCKGWFLNITEDTDDEGLTNAIKNDASERLVPVHPKLIELGFVGYVEGLANQKGRIFPELPEDIYGNPAAKWGEWFGPYLRKVCGVTDRRMTFHSFRHTFKDYARNARIEDGIQRQIMGHEGGDVADQYGAGYSLHVVAAAMATYRVPGLEIAPPV